MKIRWGIISTAQIGTNMVIPAIQKTNNGEVTAISSRSQEIAQAAADKLGIPKAYGSYEALLADPEIDAIYNPLPNHLHLEWTIKALEAGKHVLCEKPIGMDAAEGAEMLKVGKQFPKLKLMEAFMYRFHPQWKKVKDLVQNGTVGEIKTIQSFFSYFNNDPQNIRNQSDIGGGALMDIGCYCIQFPRFILDKEPQKVIGLIDRDPVMETDRLSSAMMDFGEGLSSTFTCSTQLQGYQRCNILGDKGRIEVEIPVNAPVDAPTRVNVYQGDQIEKMVFETTDQYAVQCQEFAEAILNKTAVPTPFVDAVKNMEVIDAIFKSDGKGWMSL